MTEQVEDPQVPAEDASEVPGPGREPGDLLPKEGSNPHPDSPPDVEPNEEPDEEPADRHQAPLDDPEDRQFLDPDDPRVREAVEQRSDDVA